MDTTIPSMPYTPSTVPNPDLPNARVEALAKAIDSVCGFDTPPNAAHIVERAEAFLAFIDPPAT